MVKENFNTELIKLERYGSLFLPWDDKKIYIYLIFFSHKYIYTSYLYIFISYNSVFFFRIWDKVRIARCKDIVARYKLFSEDSEKKIGIVGYKLRDKKKTELQDVNSEVWGKKIRITRHRNTELRDLNSKLQEKQFWIQYW